MSDKFWAVPGRIDRLREEWRRGSGTRDIALILGCSKNAAVGKAHRLGLEGRPSPILPPPRGQTTPAYVHPDRAAAGAAPLPSFHPLAALS